MWVFIYFFILKNLHKLDLKNIFESKHMSRPKIILTKIHLQIIHQYFHFNNKICTGILIEYE